jgi:hypothetical protein
MLLYYLYYLCILSMLHVNFCNSIQLILISRCFMLVIFETSIGQYLYCYSRNIQRQRSNRSTSTSILLS